MIRCLHCKSVPRLTNGAECYPGKPALADKPMWRCPSCAEAWVGCHPGTNMPLGFCADKATRSARIALHNSMLDPLWKKESRKFGQLSRRLAHGGRDRVYYFLAAAMGLPRNEVHTAMWTVEQCRAAWRALRDQTPETIFQWTVQNRSRS